MEEWFYEKNGEQHGPVTRDALKGLRLASEIGFSNLIWKQGMGDWAPFGEVFSAEGEGGSKLKLGTRVCPSCDAPVLKKDLIPAGERTVCPKCRDDYAQSLKEGLTAPESSGVERRGTGGMTPNRELRAMARDSLSGQWGPGALAAFVVSAIQNVAGFVPILGPIAQLVVGGPFTVGLMSYFLSVSRGEPVETGEVFSGFSRFGKAVGLQLLVSILVGLAVFAAIIPGALILVALATTATGEMPVEENPLFLLGIFAVILPAMVVGIFMMLRYSMVYFIFRDAPELSISETMSASVELTQGHKKKLFFLGFSFIGWFFLGMMAFLIGLFWVVAYFYTALAVFYDDIADEG